MRRNALALYLHIVWATWDRLPLISSHMERRVHRCIESEARDLGCSVLALDGTADHVHLVVSMPTTLRIADLVQQAKGVSSRFVNEELAPNVPFKWQGSYGAFTVSRQDVDRIVQYVRRQKEHHAANSLWPDWEQTFEDVPTQSTGTKE